MKNKTDPAMNNETPTLYIGPLAQKNKIDPTINRIAVIIFNALTANHRVLAVILRGFHEKYTYIKYEINHGSPPN